MTGTLGPAPGATPSASGGPPPPAAGVQPVTASGGPSPNASGGPSPNASGVPPTDDTSRPSIAERAARRDAMRDQGRDRYSTLLRSLQAGHELPIHRRGGRIAVDWNPILWTLVKVAIVVAIAYFAIRAGSQWWRENRVVTWTGPDAAVQSGVLLADCPVVARIRVDDFPSWITYGGSVYRYTGLKRPYLGPDTSGYAATPYASDALHLVLIDNTPEGQARNVVMVWLDGAIAGIEYARTPDCSPP